MANINVDIDIEDILWDLRDSEKQYIVDELYEDGFIPKGIENKNPPVGAAESFFNDSLEKLRGKWNMLTELEEQTINNIAKRF
jgi:hypothetical protein